MRMGWAAVALIAAAMATPAAADVKAGVRAWAQKDYAAAVAQWRGPAAAGDPDAQYNLAQAYKRGRGVAADPAQAEALYRKAAAQGQPQAQAALALMLYADGARAEALPWFEKAAAKGEPRAQYVLGTALFNGDGVGKDWPRAYALMSRAAAAGLPPARASLAQMTSYLSPAERARGTKLARAIPLGPKVDATGRGGKLADVDDKPAAPDKASGDKKAADKKMADKASTEKKPADRKVPDKKLPDRQTPAAKAATRAAIADGWRIQLGAFGQESAAKAHWAKLSAKPGLNALTPLYAARGGVVRLQAGPLDDRAAATRACALAAKAGSACFAVAP